LQSKQPGEKAARRPACGRALAQICSFPVHEDMPSFDFDHGVSDESCAPFMLRLLLLRHAEAVHGDGGSDMDRRLTPEGRAAAWRIGAYMMASGLIPDLAFVSPAQRTIETLDEVERASAGGIPCGVASSLYNASMATLLALLAETPETVRVLLVIGHNPGLAATANALSNHGSTVDLARLRAQFPAPCLADIGFKAADWGKACQEGGRLDRFITLAALQKSEEGA
jgi:phosphohistidine phosphatase